MPNFKPDEIPADDVIVPFFEDATTEEHGVRGHKTGKSEAALKAEISRFIGMMGGSVEAFQKGTFNSKQDPDHDPKKPERIGWQILFNIKGRQYKTDLACLPLKKFSVPKAARARAQALFSFAYYLEALHNSRILQPSGDPMLQYMILPNGKTFGEMSRMNQLPQLGAGSNPAGHAGSVVEGSFVVE